MSLDAFNNTFQIALDKHPHLLFDIGFNRVTGYLITVWNAEGCGIKNAPMIASDQDNNGDKAALNVGLALIEQFDLYCDVDLAPYQKIQAEIDKQQGKA